MFAYINRQGSNPTDYIEEAIMSTVMRHLSEKGMLFLQNAKTAGGDSIYNIDSKLHGNGLGGLFFDDLGFPVVRVRSKIPLSERMKLFGVKSYILPQDYSGSKGPQGHPIPTHDYIDRIMLVYGDSYETRTISLESYASKVRRGEMTIDEAINAAGNDLHQLLTLGEYELSVS
jgi:hypothetical protein